MATGAKRSSVWCLTFLTLHFTNFSCGNHRAPFSGLKKLVLGTVPQGHIVGELVQQAGIFWGIPYSQPPVGEYRFKNPRDPIPFKEEFYDATYKRPGCKQICHNAHAKFTCPQETSEDCLFLNVFVPRRLVKKASGKRLHFIPEKYRKGDRRSLAVMLFLHGGSFRTGAGSAVLYDSRFLAQRGDVVVVTINYRLGPLGFLVQGNGENGASGNYGILDQIKALEWVKNNILHFGGDPKKITLFGQSAGAESVGILATSPLGKGLFHKAIYESDSLSLSFRNLTEARNFSDILTQKLNCKKGDMTCLRKRDADDIIRAGIEVARQSLFSPGKALYAFQPWAPVVDGKVMISLPMERFKECPTFACDNKKILSKLATDYTFACPARKVLSSIGPKGWFYIFNASVPYKSLWGASFCSTGVCHGAELPYVFDSSRLTPYSLKDGRRRLSRKIQYYWSNFAKYGDPNGKSKRGANCGKAEYWNRFVDFSGATTYQALDMTPHGNFMLSDPYKNICDFWEGLDLYGKL